MAGMGEREREREGLKPKNSNKYSYNMMPSVRLSNTHTIISLDMLNML